MIAAKIFYKHKLPLKYYVSSPKSENCRQKNFFVIFSEEEIEMKKRYQKPVVLKKEQNRVYCGSCGNCATPGCGKQVVGTW